MYDKIQSRLSVPQLYEQKLVVRFTDSTYVLFTNIFFQQNEQTLTTEDIANVREQHKSNLNDKLDKVPSYVPSASMLQEQWAGMVWPISKGAVQSPETGVNKDTLIRVGRASVQVPEDFVSFSGRIL